LRICGDYNMELNIGCYNCPPTTMCEDVDKCDFEQPNDIPQNCCE